MDIISLRLMQIVLVQCPLPATRMGGVHLVSPALHREIGKATRILLDNLQFW